MGVIMDMIVRGGMCRRSLASIAAGADGHSKRICRYSSQAPTKATNAQLNVSDQASAERIVMLVAFSTMARMPTNVMADSAWISADKNDSMMPRRSVRSLART